MVKLVFFECTNCEREGFYRPKTVPKEVMVLKEMGVKLCPGCWSKEERDNEK